MSVLTIIFLSVFAVSLASLAGVVLLSFNQSLLKKILLYLVSFAVGALFANTFLHVLPEAVEASTDLRTTFGLVLVGIILSFIIEKFVHWHHCHNLNCKHVEPVGIMMLIGDGIHNITDGILIATTFLVDVELGIATTIAVILHEIPQEIGDFAVLIHSGFSKARALLWNFVSALTAFLGAFLVIVLHEHISGIEVLLLPIVAGNFLYIAGSDLIPELHKESKPLKALTQLLCLLAGIALMYGLTSGEQHHHVQGSHEDEMHDDQDQHMMEESIDLHGHLE